MAKKSKSNVSLARWIEQEYSGDFNYINKSIKKLRAKRKLFLVLRILASVLILTLLLLILFPRSIFTQAVDLYSAIYGNKTIVVFANNHEIRPSGGFIGSYAILNSRRILPKIENFNANIYNQDNEFAKESFVPLPAPLQIKLGANTSWTLHDSNWDPDFRLSAQNILWFYNQENNEQLDGVIQITASCIADLLNIIGPITTADGTQFNAQNFMENLNYKIEKDYWADPRNEEMNLPKSVISNMIPQLIGKLYHASPIRLFEFLNNALQKKDIMLYSTSPWRQALIEKHNWAGTLNLEGNFLYYVQSNVDSKTSQSISSQVKIDTDRGTFEIARQHNGTRGNYGGGDNNTYIQLLLPLGTEIISAQLSRHLQDDSTSTDIQKNLSGHSREGGNLKDVSVSDYTNNLDRVETDHYVSYGFWTTLTAGQTESIEVKVNYPPNLKLEPIRFIYQPGIRNNQFILR